MCSRTTRDFLSVIINAHYFLIRALVNCSSSRLDLSDSSSSRGDFCNVQTVKQSQAFCCFVAKRVRVVLRSRVVSYSFHVIFSVLSRNVLRVSFEYSIVIYSGFVEDSFEQYRHSYVVCVIAFRDQFGR